MYKAEIIADSVNNQGNRLTTFVLCFPRIILSEFNTHRMLSRNSASSRAIPFKKMVDRVENNPFVPIAFQKDHKGMQGTEYLEGEDAEKAKSDWLEAKDKAVSSAKKLNEQNLVTKQLCNRLLEPFMWHTVIATATDWENFFALRAHDAAEIHIQKIAYMMLDVYNKNEPKFLEERSWHIPFGENIDEDRIMRDFNYYSDEIGEEGLYTAEIESLKIKIATARCARVSYLNYEGKDDYVADVKLHDRLAEMGHWSPFEHCAQVLPGSVSGNFAGFLQYRKMFDFENRTDSRVKIINS